MPKYLIKYTSSKSGACEYVSHKKTMKEAVKEIVDQANKRLIDVYDISVQLHDNKSKGVQQFCHVCKYEIACYGIKGKWYCPKCKPKT